MQLTQEHFDNSLNNLFKELADIKRNIATKTNLKDLSAELKDYVAESFETQQFWMDERFEGLISAYDVRDRVNKLEKDFLEFKLNSAAHS